MSGQQPSSRGAQLVRQVRQFNIAIACGVLLLVGGKAAAKRYALRRHTEILFLMGRVWYWCDQPLARLGMRRARRLS